MIALITSWSSGTPTDLPAASLDWAPLFHVERVVALVGLISGVALVGWRAVLGDLPIRVGHLAYAEPETSAITIEHEQRICSIENQLRGLRR
jgi:hypothetical protein